MRILLYNSIVLTGIIAAVVTVLCVVLCNGILRVLSTPESIWADTHSYILVIFIGIPFTSLYNSATESCAIGDSRTPFLILAVSAVSNIFLISSASLSLDGVYGAAIATVGSVH